LNDMQTHVVGNNCQIKIPSTMKGFRVMSYVNGD
jgi:hypothetical protein